MRCIYCNKELESDDIAFCEDRDCMKLALTKRVSAHIDKVVRDARMRWDLKQADYHAGLLPRSDIEFEKRLYEATLKKERKFVATNERDLFEYLFNEILTRM